ncbi:hypothetical protein F4813DRAFT_353026 [Daldinia decipiens]|uniref:uncharacterized protein n=1 Tax=Daldinia decipiens TaxID=326647 RepID=UPI0020C44FA3|nr:uncharacterized protein F4813DRAFT_353026 [Daldinia decipiens]KAI1659452.1 hypothetical protein F4813DRAFT_353026 [Daldinia decipiens]
MKLLSFPISLLLYSATVVIASSEVIHPHGLEQRDITGHSELAARAQFTFVVQCSPYKGKDGTPRKGARETCNTMCFGTKCHFKKNTYTFDGANEAKKRQRRQKAGCNPTKQNICKKNKKFRGKTGCDEFPLASTLEADKGNQIFRCVPEIDNNSQGGQAKSFTGNKSLCTKFPCKFSFSFEGAKPYKYCASKPNCKSDGNFFTKGNKPVKRDLELEPEVEQGGYYQLRSGATIYSPSDLEIGSFAVRNIYANQTIDEAEAAHLEARGLFEDGDDDDEEMIQDEIIQKL